MTTSHDAAERKRAFSELRQAPRRARGATWIYDTIRTGIREGFYASGESFNEAALMSAFNVTRASVREALLRLTEEGLVARTPRIGTVPITDTVHVTVDDDVSEHIRGVARPGEHYERLTSVRPVPASAFVAAQLLVDEGEVVRLDESIVTMNDAPFATCMLYSLPGWMPSFGMTGGGAYPFRIEKTGFAIETIRSNFEAIGADADTAARLRVEIGSPILLRTLTIEGRGDSRLLSIIRMRGDRTVVHTERTL